MKPESEKLLEKASRAIPAAETLLHQGYVDFATGCAYGLFLVRMWSPEDLRGSLASPPVAVRERFPDMGIL